MKEPSSKRAAMMAEHVNHEKRLERDVAAVLIRHRDLLAGTGGRTDARRLLVVLSAARGAEQHLPRSLPRLFAQTREMGRSVDLLIGCNNGFEPPGLADFLERALDCRVIEGFCTKEEADKPAPVVDRPGVSLRIGAGTPGEDRCFLIRQRAAPDAPPGVAAGKIRMLGDLYGLIGQSIATGWQPPRFLLACDSESEFDQLAAWSADGFGDPGLPLLIARLENDPHLELVGTRSRFVAFEAVPTGGRRPRPDWQLPPIQLYLNLVHARSHGFMWLPGGGTIGRTDVMTALFSFICSAYPGVRTEDIMLSLLAQAAGFIVSNEPRVTSLNHCAPASEKALAREQIERYLSGQKDLLDKFGPAATGIVPTSTGEIVAAGYRLAASEIRASRGLATKLAMLGNTARIIGALPHYLEIARSAVKDNSDDPSFFASW